MSSSAEEGVVREQLPASDDPTRSTVPAVYLVPFHRAERSLAGGLLDLLNSSQERLPAFTEVDWHKALGWLQARTGQDLAPGQQEAVQLALTSKVAVLTGGPGCGKSFTVRSVVELATAKKATVVLVAPTGRAAKRLAELTGHDASTVHRLLELQPGGEPKYDRDHPLDADLVVVDECSMMDVILANKLIKAIPDGAHLLLVGDVDQLPSVGAGEVLRDLLAAEHIPRVRLTQIFRQAQQSGIVVNAHRINHGQPPRLTDFRDFYWFTLRPRRGLRPAPGRGDRQTRRRHRRPPHPRQIRARPRPRCSSPHPDAPRARRSGQPQRRAARGAHPRTATGLQEKRYGDRVFRAGDKVIQLRNNYTKGKAGIFNGTIGTVTSLSLQEQTLTVLTDEDEHIDYDFAELDELAHAYAITIHRSQGSEYPAVVIPLTTSSWMMLQRNLLYTGITRAKQLIVLVGSRRALAQAIRTPGAGRRHTALTHRLAPSNR